MESNSRKNLEGANGDKCTILNKSYSRFGVNTMKVAVVHDWMVGYTGGEKVVHAILEMFPESDVYTLVDFLPEEERDFLRGHKIVTSFLQKIPGAKKHYRSFLPLMPLAIEVFDFHAYDLVISSSAAISKGLITGPETVHVAYVHTPPRYAWDLQNQYLSEANAWKGIRILIARLILHYTRLWDVCAGMRPDYLIANSHYVQSRIAKVYRRPAKVIYPPVEIDKFSLCKEKKDYYVTVSRMVPYKKIDLIVDAFNRMQDKELIIIGDGPELPKIKRKGGGNIKIMGYQPFPVVLRYVQEAKGFVYAAEEDFGIAVVEAMACGTPVIAYRRGGTGETVIDGETGMLFEKQTVESIIEVINKFENHNSWNYDKIRKRSEDFSKRRFQTELGLFLEGCIQKYKK